MDRVKSVNTGVQWDLNTCFMTDPLASERCACSTILPHPFDDKPAHMILLDGSQDVKIRYTT